MDTILQQFEKSNPSQALREAVTVAAGQAWLRGLKLGVRVSPDMLWRFCLYAAIHPAGQKDPAAPAGQRP